MSHPWNDMDTHDVRDWADGKTKMKAPSFPLYVNNWLASCRVSAMTPEQEGGYIHLLCHEWNSPDCTLPNDDAILSCLSRLGDRWAVVGERIKACFSLTPAGTLRNERLHKCYTETAFFRQLQKERANARWMPERCRNDAGTMPHPMPNVCSESESESDLESESEKLSQSGVGRGKKVDIPPELKPLIDMILSVKTPDNDLSRIPDTQWYNELVAYKTALPPAALTKIVQQFVADMENAQERFSMPTASLRKRLSIASRDPSQQTAGNEMEAVLARQRARGRRT